MFIHTRNSINNSKVGIDLYYNNVSWNFLKGNEVCIEEQNCIGNFIENNTCVNPSDQFLNIIGLIALIISALIVTIIISAAIIKGKKIPEISVLTIDNIVEPVQYTLHEDEEISQTESEMDIEEDEYICVVHKGIIDGAVYICPKCKTFYCTKCVEALKENHEKCWTCDSEFII